MLAGTRPVKARGSVLARGLLHAAGWELAFDGLPCKQGVIMAYPHTSNWDFVLGVMAKWAFGLNVKFWGKDSLFRIPLFGAWVRWLGGVPVNRGSASGLVADTVARIREAQAKNEEFWLALAPEGTRAYADGWRSGAYHVAVQAGVPVGLAYFDFGRKRVGLTYFVQLSGDPQQDLALFADYLSTSRGKRPELASPVRLKT